MYASVNTSPCHINISTAQSAVDDVYSTPDSPVENPISKPPTLDNEKYSMITSFTVHTLLFGISSLFERCLATLMGLQTFEHGTAITSYASIITTGVNPSYGGSGSSISPLLPKEEKIRFKEHCKGKFHVVFDQNLREEMGKLGAVFTYFIKVFTAKFFAGFAGTAQFRKIPIICHLIGLIHFIACPILRFHYTRAESDQIFKPDPDTAPIGATTEEALPTHRIGMWGVLKHGSFSGLASRFYNRPAMMTACVVGVVAGAALTAVGLGFVF